MINSLSPTRSSSPIRTGRSGFGWRTNPYTQKRAHHNGVDIPGSMGDPVRASHDGKIADASWVGGYGNLVDIENTDSNIKTRYAHLSKFSVRVGDNVKAGDLIGYVGSTGNSTGPHLHFEVHEMDRGRWIAINPSSVFIAKNRKKYNKIERSPVPPCAVSFIGECQSDND